MVVSDEIYKKAQAKQEQEKRLLFCVNMRICPVCGESLTVKGWQDGGEDYTCTSCKFTHSS